MPSVAEINRWAEAGIALGWAVAWQSTLVALGVAILSRGLARSSPSARYWLWQVVALKLLLMPLWTVAVPAWAALDEEPRVEGPSVPAATAPPLAAEIDRASSPPGPVAATPPPDGASAPSGWRGAGGVSRGAWLMLAWLGLAAVRMVALARQWRGLSALLGQSRPLDRPSLMDLVADASARLGLRRPPRVLVAEGPGSPFVVGIRLPTLVLPARLLDALDDLRWRPVIFHELAHIRRGDLVWGWVPELAVLLYPFHPVAHWVAYRTRLERELACDALALEHGGLDAPGYAMTLVDVVGLAPRPPARDEARFLIPPPLPAIAKESPR